MNKQITKEEFESLKLQAASVQEERDIEYSYEALLDADENQIALASYHSFREPTFTAYDPPYPKAVFNEDGDMIVDGWC